jgi:hypothetical protein
MKRSEIQQWYVMMLMEKVAQDRFPSGEHMNRIEASLATREQLETYLELLLEKVEGLRYPSLQMLDRIQRLAMMLPDSGAAERAGVRQR